MFGVNCARAFLFVFVLVSFLSVSGCAPKTFIKTMDPGWNSVELRDQLSFDEAWNSTVDTIARQFDIEVLSKEDGYLRTGWLHSWTGELKDSYKVRAMIKFSPDKRKLEVKSEAQHFNPGLLGMGKGWVMGTDERLTTTLRTDLMGKVGRVAR